ncbi:hypothetical protein ACHAPO_011105 [Fusarium lateritium]
MAEIFTAVIVATIMTMRPCFQVFFSGIATTVTSTSLTRLGTSRTRMDSSGVMISTTSQKRKVDRQGFNKIGPTKTEIHDIELQSRDHSTEELFPPERHENNKVEKT